MKYISYIFNTEKHWHFNLLFFFLFRHAMGMDVVEMVHR